MAYATPDDLIARYGEVEIIQISTPDGQAMDQVNTPLVTIAINDASDMIDSYLRRRYVTPVATPPLALTQSCCAIARFMLCQMGGTTSAEKVKDAYQAALSWLRKVEDGSVTLDGELLPNTSPNWAEFQGRERTVRCWS